ncbi:MAG: ABC transporter ATP-binding protein [Elusimicrobiaceae bacterium]|nr:ABC transporter ATP-binding protein [Elusimicrobiaceae bacterium]
MLEVKNLIISVKNKKGKIVPLVKNLSYTLKEGETLAVVGESGCGKTIQALSIMGLLPPNISVTKGQILFQGKDILQLSTKERREINGKKIALVFQDALTALNPVMTIREHLLEVFAARTKLYLDEAEDKIKKLLEQVELPESILSSYPHQISGGQRQRVMLALALALKPKLLIADEPTTALDENTQKQILDLIKKLQKTYKMAVIFITHDLILAKEIADKIFVLYYGTKVEEASSKEIFSNPLHPYTYGLFKSIITKDTPRGIPLFEIYGSPKYAHRFYGCPFKERCKKASRVCYKFLPSLEELRPKHFCACFWAKSVDSQRRQNGL